jgi:uncharacterized protein (DUF111 family)
MAPEGAGPYSPGVTQAVDPDSYFAERGYALRVEERNLDNELPTTAATRGSTHWADLVSAEDGRTIRRAYGAGKSDQEARIRALRRWWVEEEPPEPPLPHRLA